MGTRKEVLLVWLTALLLGFGCARGPRVDLLAPKEGRAGEVIDLRDAVQETLGTEGAVYFGNIEATGIRAWTPTDVYVEVPQGISGTVPVRLVRGGQISEGKMFHLRQEAASPRVLSFGDSFTYWGSRWVGALLEADPFMAPFDPLHLNHGRRGEKLTDPGAFTRWQNALAFCDAEYVVLMHGANDLTDVLPPEDGITLEEIRQAMTALVEEASLSQATLILCTLPPRVNPCGDALSPTTEEYNDWLRAYASEQGIPLVDVYDDFIGTPGWAPLYFGGNCLHPAEAGYIRIAELVTEKIVNLYLPTCTDLDGDGYGAPAAPPCTYPEPDCDDSDPAVHPGAVEGPLGDPTCSDGADNDCDGLADEADDGCRECTVPADCDDGDVCTDEDCVGYACVYTFNTAECDDGDPCTMNDLCSEGACGGEPLDGDGDGYVSDGCGGTDCDDSDPAVHPGAAEEPFGDPICSDGVDNDCDGDADQEDPGCWECTESAACDDGLWCNGAETCVLHLCQPGPAPDCDDGIPCTEDACDEGTDACVNLPNPGLCDDGDPCTDDVCDPLIGCGNPCHATDPGDPCCLEPACTGSPSCQSAG